MSLHTRNTCQRALAAFISTAGVQIGDGGPIQRLADFPAIFTDPQSGAETTVGVGVHIACGELKEDGSLPDEWTALKLPSLIVNSLTSQPHDIGYEICDVTIFAMSTVTEKNAPQAVDDRAGWLEALFGEEALEDIATELSAPAAAVQGFTTIGIERDGTAHRQQGDYILSGLKLRVHCTAR